MNDNIISFRGAPVPATDAPETVVFLSEEQLRQDHPEFKGLASYFNIFIDENGHTFYRAKGLEIAEAVFILERAKLRLVSGEVE